MTKKSLSIIGFGPFGQFIAPHLVSHFEVFVWNRTPKQKEAQSLNVQWTPLEQCLQKDIIILCTAVVYFEQFLIENGHNFNPRAIVADVASVKMIPVALMQKYLPKTCEIIATHPLFGPESGKNGIANLNCVLCNVRTHHFQCIDDFLSNTLNLNVLHKTPEQHDREMAYVQALTHFVARAIDAMQIPETEQNTKAFQALLDVRNYLSKDSYDLFYAIETMNPFAMKVRKKFIDEINKLEKKLDI